MRRYAMPDRQAIGKLRPHGRSDWRQLGILGSYLLLVVVVVAGVFIFKHHRRVEREQNWDSAIATIEDVRTQQATIANSQGGAAMLYDVQVLAKYVAIGKMQERWITVQQRPQFLSDAQLEKFRWKGKTCVVHWKPEDLDQVFADVS